MIKFVIIKTKETKLSYLSSTNNFPLLMISNLFEPFTKKSIELNNISLKVLEQSITFTYTSLYL